MIRNIPMIEMPPAAIALGEKLARISRTMPFIPTIRASGHGSAIGAAAGLYSFKPAAPLSTAFARARALSMTISGKRAT